MVLQSELLGKVVDGKYRSPFEFPLELTPEESEALSATLRQLGPAVTLEGFRAAIRPYETRALDEGLENEAVNNS